MSSVKSGKHIYVEGTGNTLSSVASDINDPAYCTYDAPTQTLTIFGTAADIRYFRIRNNGVLDMNSGDTLLFDNDTADDTRFYLDAGGEFNMNDDCTLDGSANGNRPYYWYIYGKWNVQGTATLRPLIKNYYRIYMYETNNGNSYPDDIWTFDNCLIGGSAINNGYCFYFSVMGKTRAHSFTNMEFDESVGSNLDSYAFYFLYGNTQADNMTFDNITFTRVERGINNVGGWPVHIQNSTFNNLSTSWAVLTYSQPAQDYRDRLRNYGLGNEKAYGQSFMFIDNCTFQVGNQNNKMITAYGGLSLVKDCDFQRTTGDALEANYRGRCMAWTGNTFADANPFDVDQNGEISWVYRCRVTVEDESGDGVEDAVVHFKQAQGKEEFTFTTITDGKLHAIHGLEGAMLTQRSQYANTNGSGEIWASASLLHEVTISKPGYVTQMVTAQMTQDRDITVTLIAEGASGGPDNFSQSDKFSTE